MKKGKKRGLRYCLNLLIAGLLFGVLLYFQMIVFSLMRPAPGRLRDLTPADVGLAYEDVSLKAHDGAELAGWYIPSQNEAAVILLHGYGGNRLGVMQQAQMLAGSGFGVLLYDQRACGASGGDKRSWGWLDVHDVPSALAYLQARPEVDPERIGVFGASTGGEVAIGAAALNEGLRAVVSDGAGYATTADLPPRRNLRDWIYMAPSPLILTLLDWETGADPPQPLVQAIAQISPRPLLLISAGQDFEQYQNDYYEQLAGEPKEHWNIPEAKHNGGMLVRWDEYEQRLIKFFSQALLE